MDPAPTLPSDEELHRRHAPHAAWTRLGAAWARLRGRPATPPLASFWERMSAGATAERERVKEQLVLVTLSYQRLVTQRQGIEQLLVANTARAEAAQAGGELELAGELIDKLNETVEVARLLREQEPQHLEAMGTLVARFTRAWSQSTEVEVRRVLYLSRQGAPGAEAARQALEAELRAALETGEGWLPGSLCAAEDSPRSEGTSPLRLDPELRAVTRARLEGWVAALEGAAQGT